MRHHIALFLALAATLAASDRASAVIGTIDDVPAATLLLPYFEVELDDNPDGINTLFSINNASATAVLAHVTVWSDQSVPVLDFDVYLTGYDVQTISMRDIFVNGNLPTTASAGQDPRATPSARRGRCRRTSTSPRCSALPYSQPRLERRRSAPTCRLGSRATQSPSTGNCAGSKQQDNILRGYVTVDTVNACNLFFPSDWALYAPFVTDQNVLWGDYFYVNAVENFAQGETLVHIESCPTCFVPGDHTFYGRYNGATADDAREALPTTEAARFVNGGGFDGGTDFLIWREANSADSAYSCALQGPRQLVPARVDADRDLRRAGAAGHRRGVPLG